MASRWLRNGSGMAARQPTTAARARPLGRFCRALGELLSHPPNGRAGCGRGRRGRRLLAPYVNSRFGRHGHQRSGLLSSPSATVGRPRNSKPGANGPGVVSEFQLSEKREALTGPPVAPPESAPNCARPPALRGFGFSAAARRGSLPAANACRPAGRLRPKWRSQSPGRRAHHSIRPARDSGPPIDSCPCTWRMRRRGRCSSAPARPGRGARRGPRRRWPRRCRRGKPPPGGWRRTGRNRASRLCLGPALDPGAGECCRARCRR